MELYCWGNTANGELGVGGIENEQILIPTQIPWEPDANVQQVACGYRHTLFLTTSGNVYSCGNNDQYQLGHDRSTKRPRMSTFLLVPELKNYVIVQIACGARHSMALTDWGQVLSWGDNDCGQLGQDLDVQIQEKPKIVRKLVTKTVVQIACGSNHSMVLTNCGELYSWGSNIYGQLGVQSSKDLTYSNGPIRVSSLLGIPPYMISCGGHHSFIISKSCTVFGWGRNNCGQLGLNDKMNRSYPVQLKTLRTLAIRYIACGDEFSVFLTNEGGVFTCGAGAYGQLGHGCCTSETLPRMVIELMGSTITQVACGNRHTLALVPSGGRVYAFGLGSSGQLGSRNTKNLSSPQVVVGPWVSPSGSGLLQQKGSKQPVVVQSIFSGGDQSILTTTLLSDKVMPLDFRIYPANTQILTLTADITRQCASVKETECDLDLLHNIEFIFKSQSCLNGSFLKEDDTHFASSGRNYGLNLKVAQEAFDNLRRMENANVKQLIWDCITKDQIDSLVAAPADVDCMRVYLLLPLYHEFVNSKNYMKLHIPFITAILKLTEIPQKLLRMWWRIAPVDYFEYMVSTFVHVVAHIISFKLGMAGNRSSSQDNKLLPYNRELTLVLRLLEMLRNINNQRDERLHHHQFCWCDLTDYVNLQQEYARWILSEKVDVFNICRYPFLFNAAAKTLLLQTDQALQMHSAMTNTALNAYLNLGNIGPSASQYVVLNVSRENLIEDTLRELTDYNAHDLKKPLKIKFRNEEAEDAGGVRKEFFMLLIKDMMNPKYGMFKEYEETHLLWFAELSFETESMYYLIGLLCGLAIYNFTIINLPFPVSLYKKLLGKPVDLSDLRDLSPTLANSMQSILDYQDNDFENVFNIAFDITRDLFGKPETTCLKPNGDKIQVTRENRKEFVDLYVDFILNKSIHKHYMAFHKGFMKVCAGRVLQIFQPEELMAVVVGTQEYDWQELENNCEYRKGYTSGHETIKWFWEVIHSLPEGDKRKFLLFLTGSDRIPMQGMKAVKIIIQPTHDERFLPVAHTCFNMLDLPYYKTKERLKCKLLQAIQETQGFTLV